MPALEVNSPNGQVRFKLLPNAERLTFTVTLGNTTVIDPSPIVLNLDGYDLSAGVVMGGVVRDEVKESYPWSGVRSTAVSHSNRAKISLTNDLTSISVHAGGSCVRRRRRIPPRDSRRSCRVARAGRVARRSTCRLARPSGTPAWKATTKRPT